MQSASSRIWTRVAVSIPYDDNHFTTGTSTNMDMRLMVISIIIRVLGTISKSSEKIMEESEIRGRIETIETTGIVEIGQNTEKSPGDLKGLTVTQTPVKTIS